MEREIEREFSIRFRWKNNLCSSIVDRIMQHVVYNDKGVPVQPLVPGDTWLPPGYFPCHAHLLAPAFAGLAFYHLGRTCTFFKFPLMEKCRKTMRVFFFLGIRRCHQVLLKQYKDRQVIRHSFYFFFYSILFLLWSSLHLTIPPRSSNSFLRTRLILSWRLRYSRNLRNRKGTGTLSFRVTVLEIDDR